MIKEIWKNIPGYEEIYQASDQGRVKSLKRIAKRIYTKTNKFDNYPVKGKILKPINHCNYNMVNLSINGNMFSLNISYLVLLTFVGKRPKNYDTSHLNGNSLDDRLINLAWETRKENQKRKVAHGTDARGEKHVNSKLKNKDIFKIRKMLKDDYTQTFIANKFNVRQCLISAIKSKKTWFHI